MSKKKQPGYNILLILTIVFTLCALWTLVPSPNASKECLWLGYKAHCTWTPLSTIICLLMAGTVCKIRAQKFKS